MKPSITLSKLKSSSSLKAGNEKTTIREYEKNEFIYLGWETVDSIYVIINGYVKLGYYSDGGKERISAILSKGDMLGNLSMRDKVIQEYAQTLTKVDVKVIDADQYFSHYVHQNSFMQKVVQSLEDRYHFVEQQMRSAAFLDVKSRIISFLDFLADSFGKNFGGVIHIPNFLTHEDIANFNLTSRQTVTMILAELRRQGTIHYDRHQIKIYPQIKELSERRKVS